MQRVAMNPDIFLKDDDVAPLFRALRHFAEEVDRSSPRRAALHSANIPTQTLYGVHFDESAPMFAVELLGAFRDFSVSDKQPGYHPLVNFLNYLLSTLRLEDEEESVCKRLLARGQEHLKAITARSAVGRIESPQGKWVGTGVFVGNGMILTCHHIMKAIRGQHWMRFGYKLDKRGMLDEGVSIELEPGFIAYSTDLDLAMVKLKFEPQRQPAAPFIKVLDYDQIIYLIHHPEGRPVEVSDPGRIVEVGDEYISHTIPTKNGSSGAPILDRDWQFVAIHRGNPGNRELALGTTSGIPLAAFWQTILLHLSS